MMLRVRPQVNYESIQQQYCYEARIGLYGLIPIVVACLLVCYVVRDTFLASRTALSKGLHYVCLQPTSSFAIPELKS